MRLRHPFLALPLRLAAAASLLAALGSSAFAGFPFNSSASVQWIHDSNLARAVDGSPHYGDTAMLASLSAEQPRVLSRDWLASWGGSLEARRWFDTANLDAAELGASASLRRKFGLGVSAPSATFGLRGGRRWVRTEDLSGWLGAATFSVAHRPLDWLRWTAAAELDRFSSHQAFFSGDGHTFSGEFHCTVHPRVALSLAARQRMGTVFAHEPAASAWMDGTTSAYAYNAWWPRRLVSIFDAPTHVYALEARTRGAALGVVFSIGPRASLALRWDSSLSRRGSLSYRVNQGTIDYTRLF